MCGVGWVGWGGVGGPYNLRLTTANAFLHKRQCIAWAHRSSLAQRLLITSMVACIPSPRKHPCGPGFKAIALQLHGNDSNNCCMTINGSFVHASHVTKSKFDHAARPDAFKSAKNFLSSLTRADRLYSH